MDRKWPVQAVLARPVGTDGDVSVAGGPNWGSGSKVLLTTLLLLFGTIKLGFPPFQLLFSGGLLLLWGCLGFQTALSPLRRII